jgi:hypothetical protein
VGGRASHHQPRACVLAGDGHIARAAPSASSPGVAPAPAPPPTPAEKCGDEFAAHLCGRVLPSLGLPSEVQQQLVFHVRESDPKQLKDCLRSVLLQTSGGAGAPR